MAFNRFRIYDVLQKSLVTFLFGTTIVGGVFVTANVYNNWVEKRRLQSELAHKKMLNDDAEASKGDSRNSS
ncbi:hypothetical protein LPJ61_002332 [Coemansia biformis]|uniref:Uncharacterized protein n=1 Tax=Coemansia biformis TaxID=1286918 RepID=A0A9W7YG06_9FUNG|nr:hypothetical protein LPJ61_002332 [Coemansia biformis]